MNREQDEEQELQNWWRQQDAEMNEQKQWYAEYDKEEPRMDMSQYKAEGNTTDLQAKDFIGKNLKLTIERVETVTYPADDNKPEQTRAVLYFVGKEKRIVLNGTNTEILCDAYGSDSEGWVGKEIGATTKDYTKKGFGHGWIIKALDAKEPEFDSDIPF